MSSIGFQQKTAEQRSLEGRKIVSYDDIEQRNYEYCIGPRDNSGHEEGCADHQDRAWYYGEGENGEGRLERKYRSASVYGYVDLDKPAEKKSTQ
ncbi:hypothetical protein MBLNU13_g08272t1 [Cladosporium sp. NU13]